MKCRDHGADNLPGGLAEDEVNPALVVSDSPRKQAPPGSRNARGAAVPCLVAACV